MSNRIKKAKRPEPVEGPAVAVGYVHEDRLDYNFFHSFMQMLGWDAEHGGHVWRGGFVARRGSTGDLAAARNGGVSDFLAGDAEWLWWVDTDMGFAPDTIDRLLAAADPVERPVVGALCFAQREHESDGLGGYRPVAWPVVMDWSVYEGRGGFEVRWDYPRDVLVQCHGTGSACILIHRSVFERIRDHYEAVIRRRNVNAGVDENLGLPWDSWYTRVTNPTTGELVGEDLSFCLRLAQVEVPVHVHTGIQTTHRKNVWLQEQDYWRQRALAPAPEKVDELPREEWTVPRFAIVPTHNRPERLAALVAALATQADHIVVLDNASDPPVDADKLRLAAGEARVHVISEPLQPPNISRFWNIMFDRCAEIAASLGADRWDVASLNDDAIVPAGWYDICSTVLRGHPTAVIAHTGTTPIHRHELVDAVDYPREKRMCPWAHVIRGEAGLRGDESLAWFYGDDDLNRRAALAGGVLAAPGPLVINAHAVESTRQNPVLAEQAEKDRVTFAEKWARQS